MVAVCFQLVYILLNEGIMIHVSVHCRCDEDWTVNRHSDGGEGVISDTVCKLTDNIRRRRDNHEEISTVSEINMRRFPICTCIKNIQEDGVPRDNLELQRLDKTSSILRHHDMDRSTTFDELACNIKRLMDSNPTRDT